MTTMKAYMLAFFRRLYNTIQIQKAIALMPLATALMPLEMFQLEVKMSLIEVPFAMDHVSKHCNAFVLQTFAYLCEGNKLVLFNRSQYLHIHEICTVYQ